MKNIKFLFAVLVAAFITLGSTSVFAQEDGNRDANGYVVKGPYLTNGGGANWFVGIAGVGNSFYNNKEIGNYGWGGEVTIGKWFTPSIGGRVGYSYGFNTIKTDSRFSENFVQQFVHADALWNFSNAVGGYKETRFWDIIPYAQVGAFLVNDDEIPLEGEFGIGAGVINEFRLGSRVNLNLEVGAVVAREARFINPTVGEHCILPMATVGFTFNLGKKRNFDRYSSVAPVPVVYPFTEDDYYRLQNKANSLEKDNELLREALDDCQKSKSEPEVVKESVSVPGPLSLYFKLGKAVLSDQEIAHLNDLVQSVNDELASDKEGKRVIVYNLVGSADDATGTYKKNVALSEKRAEYVKNLLVKAGVNEDNIIVRTAEPGTLYDEVKLNRVVIIDTYDKVL